MALILSNSSINKFTQCPKRYKLSKLDGWKSTSKSDALIIGSATHKGIEIWSADKDEDAAYLACMEVEGMDEELFETVFALLDEYFRTYKDDELSSVVTELDMTVPVLSSTPAVALGLGMPRKPYLSYRAIIDGIKFGRSGYWVHEIKTSGEKPGNFWKKYDKDHQTLGYVWSVAKKTGFAIKGAVVDAIFKPGYQRPDPICERRFFPIDPEVVDNWHDNLIQIGADIEDKIQSGDFYESFNCRTGYFDCEFKLYCANGNQKTFLEATHVKL